MHTLRAAHEPMESKSQEWAQGSALTLQAPGRLLWFPGVLLGLLWKVQLCKLVRAALGRCSCWGTLLLSHHSWSIQEPTGSSPWLLLSQSACFPPHSTDFRLSGPPEPSVELSRAPEWLSRTASSATPSSSASLNNGTKKNGERAAPGWIPFGFIKISDVLQLWVLQSSPGCSQSPEWQDPAWQRILSSCSAPASMGWWGGFAGHRIPERLGLEGTLKSTNQSSCPA